VLASGHVRAARFDRPWRRPPVDRPTTLVRTPVMGRSTPPRPGPLVPLEPAQVDRLRRWWRRLITGFAAAVALLVVWALILLIAPDERWLPTLAIPFAAPLVVVGALIQRSQPCPRCGRRIRLATRLALPRRCAGCGVSFRLPGHEAAAQASSRSTTLRRAGSRDGDGTSDTLGTNDEASDVSAATF